MLLRKLSAFFLSFTAVISLSSCAPEEDDKKEVIALTLWHYYNGTQLIAFDTLVQEFNETTGRDMNIFVESVSQGSVNSLADKVLESASGTVGVDKLPDIFGAYGDTALIAKNMGLTASLESYLTEEEINSYVNSFMDEGRFPPDYSYTIMPVAKSNELLLLDRIEWENFVAESDKPVSGSDLSTWEGIVRVSKDYYEYTDGLTPEIQGDGKSFFGIDSYANYFFVSMFQKGLPFAEYTDGELVFNLDKEIMKEVWDLYFDAYVRGYFGAIGKYRSDDVKTGFLSAYIASKTGSRYFPNIITLMDGTEKEADLTVLPYPVFEGAKKASIQQGAGMVVTKSDAEREKAAVEFLKWFTEADRNASFSNSSSYLPVKKDSYSKESIDNLLKEFDLDDDYSAEYDKKSFIVAVEQLNTHESYFPVVYENSFEVRRRIDETVAVLARSAEVVNTNGFDEAAAQELRDKEFDTLYNDLVNILKK